MTKARRWSTAVAVGAGMAVFAACAPTGDEPREAEADVPQAQIAFFENIRELCGEAYAGETQFTAIPDNPLANAQLVMHVETCTDSVIRIPFVADQDFSRTWILTLTANGLLFKHDHRHADGTPDDTTNYGGWATGDGTATTQSFPADEFTQELLPPAATNVWTLTVDTAVRRFVYDLQRHDAPRYRAEFDLTTPVLPPQRP